MSDSYALLASKLQEMIDYCQQMSALLKADEEHFKKDDLTAIEEANQRKISVMTKLSAVVNDINAEYPKGIVEEIKNSQQPELYALGEKLTKEIMGCYRLITVNNNVVISNLQMLKDVWDKLLELQSDSYVYDKVGNVISHP